MADPTRPPLVSIIVPCYNYAGYLPETLDNLRAQTWPHWECLVVDDGSTDATREVLAAYSRQDPRFRYLHQPHAGPAAARNTGLRAARGQFIQFLDADDVLGRRKLENQVAIFARTPAAGVVFSWVEFFGAAGARQRAVYSAGLLRRSQSALACLKLLVRQNVLVINAPLIRKTLVDQVGLFEESLQTVEDWNYWIRCAVAGARFEFDGHKSSRVRVRLHAQSHSTNRQRMIRDSMQVRRRLAAELAGLPAFPGRAALLAFNQTALDALARRLAGGPAGPPPSFARRTLGWLRQVLPGSR